jgi:hypothetical protein
MQEEESLEESFPEIANILQYIVEYPKEANPEIRSNAFKAVQTQTERALLKIGKHPLLVK